MTVKNYSVLDEATDLVGNQLALTRELFDTKKALIEARSRFVCRCASCYGYTERTLSWLAGFSESPTHDSAKLNTRRTRLFPSVGSNTSAA